MMRTILVVLVLLSTLLSHESAVRAQVRIPREALADASLQQVIDEGSQLENERRWGEALVHYEEALKSYPGQRDLKSRMTFARLHYEVARRYSDPSFTASLSTVTERQALDLYSEVLLNIQTHYVDSPNWAEISRRGLHSLEIALSEPAFVAKNTPQLAAERADTLRGELRRLAGDREAASRHDARDMAFWAGRAAQAHAGVTPQAAIFEFVSGAISALDEYSAYLTSNQLDEVFSQIDGNFVGLGIEIKSENQSLLIVNVIAGGPAAEAEIQPGDRIVEVNRLSTREVSTDAAADMLKGAAGSQVEVAVVAPDNTTRRLRLTRREVDVPSIEGARIVDPQTGMAYLKLASFQKTTSRQMDDALWALHRQGMRCLIVDVRGNPGGLLSASVEVADKFVTQGTIVSTRGRNRREDFDYQANTFGTWQVPLIVLIDGDSASASEIFAAAIRDHKRGTVVGQRSYGKGSVQGIFKLNQMKSGVRLTTAKFYSPTGQPISHRGVMPNVTVHTVAKPGAENDQTLSMAVQVGHRMLGATQQTAAELGGLGNPK